MNIFPSQKKKKKKKKKFQCKSLTQRNAQHQHVSGELHKDTFAQATKTKNKQQ